MDDKVFTNRLRREKNGCLTWMGAISHNGYGLLARWKDGEHIAWRAHRYAWVLAGREIPVGALVCHSCDNRLCCEIEHLFLGTAKANSRDMVSKGRSYRGPHGKGNRKLTEKQVIAIRAAYASGLLLQKELAAIAGVDPSAISLIMRGRNWRAPS